jgi:aspartate racemase
MKASAVDSKQLTLGMIAGLGVGAGIFYYRSLVNAHLRRGLSPRLLMVHADVRRVLALANARAAQELADYLADLLSHLCNGGAEIATIPAFAPQVCAQELAEITPLPLIGLLDAIVTEVERRGLRRLAIFGSRVTMETNLFGTLKSAAEVVSLDQAQVDQVSQIYGRIVENEAASEQEFNFLRSLAHTLVDQQGVDAILLAGTDLSFVFHPENTDFPHLDGARTHIEAIMQIVAPAGAR